MSEQLSSRIEIVRWVKGVRPAIYDHVFSELEGEVGGILVGEVLESGKVVKLHGSIPALAAQGGRSNVTFTHGAWEAIHAEMDRRFPNLRIVGWYHSHPGFGIFLSEHDLFIHRNFFSGEEQVAYVVDPHAGTEGMFYWRDGDVVKFLERSTDRSGELPGKEIDPPSGLEAASPLAYGAYGLLGVLIGLVAWLLFVAAGGGPVQGSSDPSQAARTVKESGPAQ